MGLLLFNAPREPRQFIQGVLDTAARPVYVGSIHQGGRLSPAPAGSAGYR